MGSSPRVWLPSSWCFAGYCIGLNEHCYRLAGQPMTITFHQPATPAGRTSRRGAPTSLMQRIEKAPLLERLSSAPKAQRSQPTYVVLLPTQFIICLSYHRRNGAGPIRTKGPRPAREVKKPKTQDELDAELDAFMNADIKTIKASEQPAAAPAAAEAQNGGGDVEMA